MSAQINDKCNRLVLQSCAWVVLSLFQQWLIHYDNVNDET